MAEQRHERNFKRLAVALIVVGFGVYAVAQGISGILDNKSQLIAPGGAIKIEVAETQDARNMGLSGRPSIDDTEGMLFVFNNSSLTNCFWMKDMLFEIDMIWLNESKEVISISPEVSPDTFPDPFCPDRPAKYGLEVGSGVAVQLMIENGSVLRF